jgi:hypothetical protein
MALSGAATAAATGSRVPGPLRRAHEQTRLILQAQSQEEESGAQQFERELVEKAAERWVSQKAAPVHDARGWAARCHIKGTQTAKVRAPLIGDREGFVLSCDGTKRLPVWRFGNRVGWLYLSIG